MDVPSFFNQAMLQKKEEENWNYSRLPKRWLDFDLVPHIMCFLDTSALQRFSSSSVSCTSLSS